MDIDVRIAKLQGLCEWDTKRITIDPRQSQQEMLDTAIHEGLHMAFPDMSEEDVITASRTISQVPWKLGFRRKK